jgi:hypothetical protein
MIHNLFLNIYVEALVSFPSLINDCYPLNSCNKTLTCHAKIYITNTCKFFKKHLLKSLPWSHVLRGLILYKNAQGNWTETR